MRCSSVACLSTTYTDATVNVTNTGGQPATVFNFDIAPDSVDLDADSVDLDVSLAAHTRLPTGRSNSPRRPQAVVAALTWASVERVSDDLGVRVNLPWTLQPGEGLQVLIRADGTSTLAGVRTANFTAVTSAGDERFRIDFDIIY